VGAEELVALVEERFGVVVTAATPFYEAPEKAIYRLDRAGGGPLVVRLFPADRPLDRVVGDAAVLRHLEAEDIPAERVVTALDGSPSVRLGPRASWSPASSPAARPA
jgi:Ser/Thr protein kinase RdoA (MazF antagonist)